MLFHAHKPLLRLHKSTCVHSTTLQLSSIFQAQQQRGKKWKSKKWGLFGDAEQRADRYEKRLRRRAGNRELKFLLNLESGVYNLPTAQQFEEKVRHTTKGKGLFGKTATTKGTDPRAGQTGTSEGFSQPGFAANMYNRAKRRTEERRKRPERDPWGYEPPSGKEYRDTFWNFFRMSWEASGGRVRHDDSEARYSFGGSRYSFGGSRSQDNFKQAYEETFAYTPLNAQDQLAKAHLSNLGMGTDMSVSSEQLKKAFLKCAVLWHPDKHNGNERARVQAEEKFKQAQDSYAFLQKHFSF